MTDSTDTFEALFQATCTRAPVQVQAGMVATSQPLASAAGLEILKQGGNAADAAVATAAMLNVVEPVSTGIGGDCFALYYNASTQAVSALNGSGRAAQGASISELRALGYTRMPEYTGHAVTVPGAVAGWCDLLSRHGSMPLATLLKPAITVAERGYPVTPWIARSWELGAAKLLRAREWACPDLDAGPEQPSGHELLLHGHAPRAGETMRLVTLAQTLRHLAQHGPAWFYQGAFAEALCAHVARYGGWLKPDDLARHHSTWDTPIFADYRGYRVYQCPPNGQGLAVILALKLLAGMGLEKRSHAERTHLMIEAMRLAFADTQQWASDLEHTRIPLDALASEAYSAQRRACIDPQRANTQVRFGLPRAGSDTVYIAVVDAQGNACSFINSLYMGTGTGLVVPGTGVSLQNRGAGFSLLPDHPNALAPGKRPYHTIIPALSTRNGVLHACFGVMGGFMQPQGQLQVFLNLVDQGMTPQQAINAPRWQIAAPHRALDAHASGGEIRVEAGFDAATIQALCMRGHRVGEPEQGFARSAFGGAQIIMRDPATGTLVGGSDGRKDGCAMGG